MVEEVLIHEVATVRSVVPDLVSLHAESMAAAGRFRTVFENDGLQLLEAFFHLEQCQK